MVAGGTADAVWTRMRDWMEATGREEQTLDGTPGLGTDQRLRLAMMRRLQQRRQQRAEADEAQVEDEKAADENVEELFARAVRAGTSMLADIDPRNPGASHELETLKKLLHNWVVAFQGDPRTLTLRVLVAHKEAEIERESEKREAQQEDPDGGDQQPVAEDASASLASELGGEVPITAAFKNPDEGPPEVRRPLEPPEISEARIIFRDSLKYEKVIVTRHSWAAFANTSRTIGWSVNLDEDCFDQTRGPESLVLNPHGRQTLIHELTHVWQSQHGGLSYIPDALLSQLWSAVTTGDRDNAYEFREALDAGKPFYQWNPEQQAYFVEMYNEALKAANTVVNGAFAATPDQIDLLVKGQPILEEIREGKGAPDTHPMLPGGTTGNTWIDLARSIVA
jgi:hypothetical protein